MRPACNGLQPGDQAEQRGLAVAGGAEQAEDLARPGFEVEAAEHLALAIGVADARKRGGSCHRQRRRGFLRLLLRCSGAAAAAAGGASSGRARLVHQLLPPREVAQRLEAELLQEARRGAPEAGAAGHLLAAARGDQRGVQQRVPGWIWDRLAPRISSISARVTGWW